jgi:hypothetical protein
MTSTCFEVSNGSVLQCVVEDAHEQAAAALHPGAARPLDAVVWLSAHLAAVTRSLHPAAERVLGPSMASRAERHRRDLELERMLRIAESRYSGDALAAGLDAERIRAGLLDRLHAHAASEHERVAALADALSSAEQRSLAEAYLDALVKAPTRPHPHLPHQGVVGAIAFRVDAIRDRVLDTMDARHVPVPRQVREHRTPGRWSSYLLGQMQPRETDPSR